MNVKGIILPEILTDLILVQIWVIVDESCYILRDTNMIKLELIENSFWIYPSSMSILMPFLALKLNFCFAFLMAFFSSRDFSMLKEFQEAEKEKLLIIYLDWLLRYVFLLGFFFSKQYPFLLDLGFLECLKGFLFLLKICKGLE